MSRTFQDKVDDIRSCSSQNHQELPECDQGIKAREMSIENEQNDKAKKEVIGSILKNESSKVNNLLDFATKILMATVPTGIAQSIAIFTPTKMFNSVTSVVGLVYRINVAIVYNSIRFYVHILIYILSFVEHKAMDVAAIKNWEESVRDIHYFATSKVLKRLSIIYNEVSEALRKEVNEEEEISESNMNSISCDKDLLDIDRKVVHLLKSAIFKSKNLKSNFTQIPSSILELASNKLSLTAEAFGHVAVDSEGNVTWVNPNNLNKDSGEQFGPKMVIRPDDDFMRMMDEIKKASEQTRLDVYGLGDFSDFCSEISSSSRSSDTSRRSSINDDYPSSWDDCPSPNLEYTLDTFDSDTIGEYYVNPYHKQNKLPSDFGSTVTLCPTIQEETSSEVTEPEQPKRKVIYPDFSSQTRIKSTSMEDIRHRANVILRNSPEDVSSIQLLKYKTHEKSSSSVSNYESRWKSERTETRV